MIDALEVAGESVARRSIAIEVGRDVITNVAGSPPKRRAIAVTTSEGAAQ